MAIERKFVAQNLKEFRIKEFVSSQLSRVGLSDIKLQRTPLGDKILITASRPGLVVGRAGSNIQKLTEALKEEFHLENPQIEIAEVTAIGLDPSIVAEMIANSMERFGAGRFKGVAHRAMQDIMSAGALGAEILISGKVPSQRARVWRFYQGYLKKCGDVAITGVDIAYKMAVLKSGAVGIKVTIMPPTTKLPDQIIIQEPDAPTIEEVTDEATKEELDAVTKEAGQDGKAEKNEEGASKTENQEGLKPTVEKAKAEGAVKAEEKATDDKKEEKKSAAKKAPAKKTVEHEGKAAPKVGKKEAKPKATSAKEEKPAAKEETAPDKKEEVPAKEKSSA